MFEMVDEFILLPHVFKSMKRKYYNCRLTIVFVLQIAAEVSAPLAKTDEIVMLGDDRTTSETARLLSNLPPAVQALTGVDLSQVSVLLSHIILLLQLTTIYHSLNSSRYILLL